MQTTLERRSERREREHATARAAILEAARRVAAREGAPGLTLRSVAAEAGYAPAALYGYFRNRNDLILALAAEDLAQLGRRMREFAKTEDAPSLSRTALTAMTHLQNSETIAAAISVLAPPPESSEIERLFNGRLIAALRIFSEAAGRSADTREEQCDVVLIAAAIAGLAMLGRSGRLHALGFVPDEVLQRLDRLFTRTAG
jgi:AcrR family transcriptional regulator